MTPERQAYNAAYYQANKDRFRDATERRRLDPEKAARDRALAAARDRRRRAALTDAELAAERERTTERTWAARLARLGLTVADYDRMLAEQGGRCAICGADRPGAGRTGRWPVDHDHVTGRVRGLLCHPCNRAIGLLRDLPEVADAVAAYLRRFSS